MVLRPGPRGDKEAFVWRQILRKTNLEGTTLVYQYSRHSNQKKAHLSLAVTFHPVINLLVVVTTSS